MTLCPVALAAGCRSCLLFRICPAKGLIGDYKKDDERSKSGPSKSNPPKL